MKWGLVSAMSLLVLGAPTAASADVVDECATLAERAGDARDAGRMREAIDGFSRCARAECPRIVREDCREALGRVRDAAPRLTIRVQDGVADLPDAQVTVDDVPVDAADRLRGVLLDPGVHVVRARRNGFVPAEIQVSLSASETRPVDLVLRPQSPRVADAPTSVERRPNRTAPIIVGGAGVVFLAVFGGLGAWTYADYKALDRRCGTGCTEAEISGPQTRALIADVALGAGVVALGVATVMWLVADGR